MSTHRSPPDPAPTSRRPYLDNPWVVMALLFFATAALGLPILWISRGFSTTAKWVLSGLVILYTLLLLWGFWLVMVWCYQRISGALG